MNNETVSSKVTTAEELRAKMGRMREAQKLFSSFSQEKVDEIFRAAAMAANKARIPLAKLAVEETGMGVVEDKVIKNHYAAEYIYNAYRSTKTCGVIEEDAAAGIKKIAEPIGLIAAVIPTTNPTSTAIFKTLICLKTRNAIVISPHPRAKKSTIEAARIVYEAAVQAGAPEEIIGWIDEPSLAAHLQANPAFTAALDVFESEPLDESSPLWLLSNAILTPHNSFVGEGCANRIRDVILSNLQCRRTL